MRNSAMRKVICGMDAAKRLAFGLGLGFRVNPNPDFRGVHSAYYFPHSAYYRHSYSRLCLYMTRVLLSLFITTVWTPVVLAIINII